MAYAFLSVSHQKKVGKIRENMDLFLFAAKWRREGLRKIQQVPCFEAQPPCTPEMSAGKKESLRLIGNR